MTAATHPAAPLPAAELHRRRAVGPPPEVDGAVDAGDDAPRLLVLLGLFTVAVLVVVVALLAAAAIDSWWALAAVLVVHALMTGASFAGVVYVFTGRRRRTQR